MKATLDLDKLLKEGQLTQAEYDKFLKLSSRTASHFYYNLMLGFAVVFVSVAVIGLLPGLVSIGVVGLVICFLGVALSRLFPDRLEPLAKTCLFVGALTFGLGIIDKSDGSAMSFLAVAIVWGGAGILARSATLTSLSVFALASCVGRRPNYLDVSYLLGLQEPLGTVFLFTPFTILMFWLGKRLPLQHRGLARAAGVSGLFLVNLGFWVGSQWGGDLPIGTEFFKTLFFMLKMKLTIGSRGVFVSPWLFAIAWTIALAVTGYWAYRHKCRRLFALVATFGALNFYTQWFQYLLIFIEARRRIMLGRSPEVTLHWSEFLEAPPLIFLIGGLLGIAYALAFRSLNSRMKTEG
jgi:energy-converting hydrogenase Eha subunit C